jgi:hypothetical protein
MSAIPNELQSVANHFFQLFRPETIDALQPCGPATIYTPAIVVWLMIYQRLHSNASLQSATDELLRISREQPQILAGNRRITEGTLSANTSSFCNARQRLRVDVADSLADTVFNTLMSATPPSWKGRRVMIVDGTTCSLGSHDELRKLYPPASNQYGPSNWPMMHLTVATELSSGCAVRPEIGAMYGPQAIGEVALAKGLFARIPANSLLMADRNFGIFDFCYAARQAGHDTITRLTKKRFDSIRKKARLVKPGCWRLIWTPSADERKAHPELPADASLSVTLHEREVTTAAGKKMTLWLVTTLSTTDGESLADLYKLRQDVETDIRDLKVTLKLDQMKSQSGGMLSKEIAMGVVTLNLVVQIRRLAAQQAGVKPRRLSFSGILSLVQTILFSPKERTWEEYQATFEQVLRWGGQRKIPNRPGRSYDRTVLTKRRKHPNRKSKKQEEKSK